MKLLTLYNKNVFISYKHSVCSIATIFTGLSIIFVTIVPYYLICTVNSDLWWQPHIVWEQPNVKFRYNYILMAEHQLIGDGYDNVGDGSDSQIVVISSYEQLNEETEKWQASSMIKYWEEDCDSNKIADQLNIQFSYNAPKYTTLNYLNLFLEFEATIEKHHCLLQLPSALILHKHPLPANFAHGEITIDGRLEFQQRSTFYCPFFMRHIKSHFYHDLIPKNHSHLQDYQLLNIQKNLRNNPGFLQFTKNIEHSSYGRIDDEVLINISIDINEIGARYHTTFWQKLLQIWIEYLSVLCGFIVIVGKIKDYMFGRQIIRAWEVVPWKKLY